MAKRYRVKITRSGLIYIVITILISVAAINTGNNLLYIISSLMLALMALSGAASLVNLFSLDISLEPAEEIFAHIPARFILRVRKKPGGSFFLTFETAFGSLPLPYLKGTSEHSLWLTLPDRGKAAIRTLRVQSGFPLGFFRRFRENRLDLRVLVYPKPVACAFPAPTGGIRGTEKRSEVSLGELGDEIRELRPYRESDPLKWVEWKATARRGRMVVREFYHLEGDTLMIDLSVKTDSWEDRISEACFLVLEGLRRRLMVGLRLPGHEVKPGFGEKHKRLLMEALALA